MSKKLSIIIIVLLILFVGIGLYLFINKESYVKTSLGNQTSEKYESVIELDFDEYNSKIKNNDTFIVLLYQTGCTHCESFEPKLNEIIKKYNLQIYSLNLAQTSEKEYAIIKNKTFITGTPTTVLFSDGKYTNKLVGNKNEDEIIKFLLEVDYLREK